MDGWMDGLDWIGLDWIDWIGLDWMGWDGMEGGMDGWIDRQMD